MEEWSGRRVSNSRPQPWQGCALPTELLPHWRREAESNRSQRICNPVHNRFAIAPSKIYSLKNNFKNSGAGDESRTRDLNLGKVALYQLSYSRAERNRTIQAEFLLVKLGLQKNFCIFCDRCKNTT